MALSVAVDRMDRDVSRRIPFTRYVWLWCSGASMMRIVLFLYLLRMQVVMEIFIDVAYAFQGFFRTNTIWSHTMNFWLDWVIVNMYAITRCVETETRAFHHP